MHVPLVAVGGMPQERFAIDHYDALLVVEPFVVGIVDVLGQVKTPAVKGQHMQFIVISLFLNQDHIQTVVMPGKAHNKRVFNLVFLRQFKYLVRLSRGGTDGAGHLDAWDNSEGAHDDGAGCVQAMEVLRLYKSLGIRPKRTVRAVMFMDEEIAQRGGKKYAELAELRNEHHYVALESDRGGLLPRGFGIGTSDIRLENMLALEKYFKPYGITEFRSGGGGVDIAPLKKFGTPLISFVPDPQRYFDYHHSPNDTFEQVNIRELQMGSAAMASLLYLIDKLDL